VKHGMECHDVGERSVGCRGGGDSSPRKEDGTVRPVEDRQVALPHALLRAREQATRLLQEVHGQHASYLIAFRISLVAREIRTSINFDFECHIVDGFQHIVRPLLFDNMVEFNFLFAPN
jgi:hypothetical protein